MDRFWERPYSLKFAVGIEDTFVPQASPGLRPLDEYELTGHYGRWREDLDLAASTGATMIRYGIPWYRVNPASDEWDWSWTDRVIDHLLSLQLVPIIDLMHYGCPLWLQGEFANPDYPHRVAEYAARFAARYGESVRFYTPMNEPLLNAMYCGEDGRWPPALTGDGGFVLLTKQLVRGIVQTQRAVADTVGDPTFVHVEATFRYTGGPEHAERIRFLRQRTWLIYDLLFGRVDGDHPLHDYLSNNGFSDEDFGTTELLPDDKRRSVWSGTEGIEELVRDFHAPYGKPIFWTETSVPGTVEARVHWLDDSLDLVHRLRSEGLPLVGYTWWPLFSLVDWAYREGDKPPEAYLWHMGMYDLQPSGRGSFLRTETPVMGAFRAATERTPER
jgi:beta-glucosidase